jgi:hypothetical protein
MSLSIDVFDDVSPEVYRGKRQLQLHIWWLGVTTRWLPSALHFAVRQAKIQLEGLGNERNAARWVAATYEVRNLWWKRRRSGDIQAAENLFKCGWRLLSDWPLRPGFLGEPVFNVRLGMRADSQKYMDPVFSWNTEEDARPVPLDHVYKLMWLDFDQERSWKICFWLSFLSESELTDLAKNERIRR